MEAYWLTAKRGKIGEIYNIGGNKSISVKNALDHLIKFSKKKNIYSGVEKVNQDQRYKYTNTLESKI